MTVPFRYVTRAKKSLAPRKPSNKVLPKRHYTSGNLKHFRDNFEHQLDLHGHMYDKLDLVRKTVTPARKQTILTIYSNVFEAPLPLIAIGSSKILWGWSYANNFGGSSATPFPGGMTSIYGSPSNNEPPEQVARDHLLTRYDSDPDVLRKGVILLEKFWGLLENDAFILAALFSRKEVHMATRAIWLSDLSDQILWNSKLGIPTVLAQELVALLLMGYKRTEHTYPDLGVVFLPQRHLDTLELANMITERSQITRDLTTLREFLTRVDQARATHSFGNTPV